jgi:hypothetical protein
MTLVQVTSLAAAFAATTIALGLALRAFWFERREGLKAPWLRPALVFGCWAALLGLVLFLGSVGLGLQLPRQAPKEAAKVASMPTLSPAQEAKRQELQAKQTTISAQLARLEAERHAIAQQLTSVEQELQKLTGAPMPTAATTRVQRASPGPDLDWIMPLSACVALTSVILLLLVGQRDTLLPRRGRFRVSATETNGPETAPETLLEQLAAVVAAERYSEGATLSETIDDHALSRLDQLDYWYLSSFCALQLASKLDPKDTKRAPHAERAARDLGRLLLVAPNMAEGEYLMAMVDGLDGRFEKALERFRRARPKLGDAGLPFDEMESQCLLGIAQKHLREGRQQDGNQAFDEVIRLRVLADKVPLVLAWNQLSQVRESLKAGRFDQVRERLAELKKLQGLDADRRKTLDIKCDIYHVLTLLAEREYVATKSEVAALLERFRPPGLPDVDDFTADEYLFPAVPTEKLALDADLYRSLYFLLAIATVRADYRRGRSPTDSQVALLASYLLRALQFEPRQRDVLASLGALYYWFVHAKREKALEWLQSAVMLGVNSKVVHRLLERDRTLEASRRQLLERFLTASSRFLDDPTLRPQVRRALLEELGQFREFQPVLLDVASVPDIEPKSPTIELLRERAVYVDGLAKEANGGRRPDLAPKFEDLHRNYSSQLATLESSAKQLEELERNIMIEVGKSVLA